MDSLLFYFQSCLGMVYKYTHVPKNMNTETQLHLQ